MLYTNNNFAFHPMEQTSRNEKFSRIYVVVEDNSDMCEGPEWWFGRGEKEGCNLERGGWVLHAVVFSLIIVQFSASYRALLLFSFFLSFILIATCLLFYVYRCRNTFELLKAYFLIVETPIWRHHPSCLTVDTMIPPTDFGLSNNRKEQRMTSPP